MKILMVNKFHYPRGGAERYCFDMTSLLRRHGHDVIPFAMAHAKNCESRYAPYFVQETSFDRSARWARPVSSLKAAMRAIYSNEARRKVESLIRSERPALAYVHNIHHQISLSILPVLKKHKIPIVWRLHDYSLFCPNSLFYSRSAICEACGGGRYYRIMTRRCRRNSAAASVIAGLASYVERLMGPADAVDLFISPSQFLRAKVIQHGLDAAKVLVIPNFIDDHGSLATRRVPPPGKEESDLLYFGRLSKEKGLETLLRAVARVPVTTLKVVGEGPQRQELEALADRVVRGRVEFVGHQDTEPLAAALHATKVVILPSEWYENCPYTILEAFAAGKPVIASRIGGIPELVEDGKDGWLFEAGNEEHLAQRIKSLLGDESKRKEFGQNARAKTNDKYAADSHYAAFMAVCSALL